MYSEISRKRYRGVSLMNFNLDNYYMMEKPSPHDNILSTYEMLEKMARNRCG